MSSPSDGHFLTKQGLLGRQTSRDCRNEKTNWARRARAPAQLRPVLGAVPPKSNATPLPELAQCVFRSARVLRRHVRLERCRIGWRVIACGGRHSRSCSGCALPWRPRSRLAFAYN